MRQVEWLRTLKRVWYDRIRESIEAKKEQFGDMADTLWGYLNKSYEDLYIAHSGDGENVAVYADSAPYYKPRINKFREFVDVYAPYVVAQNPKRRVALRRPQFSEEILRQSQAAAFVPFSQYDKGTRVLLETAAQILEWWMQYCSDEYNLVRESRLAVVEALVKGRGILWHGLVNTGSGVIPASFYESVDNLFIDPTSVTLRDAGYIIRRRRLASWLAAEILGVDERKLIEFAGVGYDPNKDNPFVESFSGSRMVEYYEVYSRVGSGATLTGTDDEVRAYVDALRELGPYQYYVISRGGDHPLNLDPDKILNESDLRQAVAWPLETYGNVMNPWPASFLDFYPHTTDPWASSPLEPGLPMQVFLDHLYGYIVSQAKRSTRTIIVVPDHVDQRFIETLMNQDEDYSVVSISRQQVRDLSTELYHVITMPPANREVWELIGLAENQFAKAVGMDQLLYGAQPEKQIRSAAEAGIRYRSATNRAQAMADTVETWLSDVAGKDGILSRLYVPFTQMANFFFEPVIQDENGDPAPGGPLTSVWASAVAADSPDAAAADFWFTVESGTGTRRDKQQQIQSAQFIAQTLLPVAMQAAAKSGDFTMFNRVLERLSNAMELDLSLFRIEPSVIPQAQAPGNVPIPPEQEM